MTDLEYNILDELYFVTSFSELTKRLEFDDSILSKELKNLIEKEWVKLFSSTKEEEIDYDSEKFDLNFKTYCYLATKRGLFEHNSI